MPNNNFFHNITFYYGPYSTLLLKHWTNNLLKIAKIKNQIFFLTKCRKEDVLPSHLYDFKHVLSFNNTKIQTKYNKTIDIFKHKLLNFEIIDAHTTLRHLVITIKKIEHQLIMLIPTHILNTYFASHKYKYHHLFDSTKITLLKKIQNCIMKQKKYTIINKEERSKWFINLSNYHIPDSITELLSLGDKFGLPFTDNKQTPIFELIKCFESNSYKIDERFRNEVRTKITGCILSYQNKNRHLNKQERIINEKVRETAIFIKNNKDILFTKADKGQITVAISAQDYEQKMFDILNDVDTYQIINKDLTSKLQTENNNLIKIWKNKKHITENIAKTLTIHNGVPPKCYGLPKIHKEGYPLRIIISTIGSPTYNLAKYFHNILESHIPKTGSFIKDSWTLVKVIKNISIPVNYLLISLDVKSLFTNVPLKLVFNGIKKRWIYIKEHTKLSITEFLKGINLILKSTCFSFKGNTYTQIHGTPMGSPISPIIADIVMQDLEQYCLKKLKYTIPFYYRYVDDIVTSVPVNEVTNIVNLFNSYHERLIFTHEIQNNNCINFLDTTIYNSNGKLYTDWYRKPTSSERYINFNSNHPINYKISVINNLTDRAILLAHPKFHSVNIELVKKILLNNEYPEYFIYKHINKRMHTHANSNNRIINNFDTDNKFDTTKIITLPYINNLSEKINNIIKQYGLHSVYSVSNKLDRYIKNNKERTNNLNSTHAVYNISCKNCDATYVGQTKRLVKTRLHEHKNNIRQHPSYHSVVTNHRLENTHDFDWDNVKILDRENNLKKRLISESIHIKKQNNSINLKTDTKDLNAIYDGLIRVHDK